QVGLTARARRHWLFGLVLAAALVLRILVALAFRPIMWCGGDSASYLATGLRLIPDPARVGGYGFMLWILRPLHSFALVAAVEHLTGLAMGVLVGLRARRGRAHPDGPGAGRADLPARAPLRAARLGRDAGRSSGALRRVRAP